MKVTDLRRKLMAALAAGGLLAPSAVYAANLNTDLVVNGGFENVDLATTSTYHSPKILDWVGRPGFAYSHDGSLNGTFVVPNYANGAAPPSSGHWYFSPNLSAPDITAPGQFYQDINVAAGDTGSAIASGFAGFNLSAYMSSYLHLPPAAPNTDRDYGNVHLDFRSSSGVSLGTSVMSDSDAGTSNVWSPNTKTGVIPIGTATVRLSVYGTPVDGGPDGYTDNVTFQVSVVTLPVLRITVNRANGGVTLSNDTGAAVNLSGYSITSGFEALSPGSWLSIADNYDNGNPGPNQVDATHSWSKLTNPSTHTDLSEADLQAGTGASLAAGRTVNLSSSSAWIRTSTEDLVFQYISGGQIKDGIISYIGNNGNPFAFGDLNTDGVINAADWVIFRTNEQTSPSGLSKAQTYRLGDLNGDLKSDHPDFVLFKQAYNAANGASAFDLMLASIPEPSSAFLVMAAGTFVLSSCRRDRINK
jgi:hypothetical protein